jgi:hypothetical protein
MVEHDAVEAALARLMPPALSPNCQHELEELIDNLAKEANLPPEAAAPQKALMRWVFGSGIAAALAGLCAFLIGSPRSATDVSKSGSAQPSFVLVSESGRIESVSDEGWQEDVDGFAMHTLRLNVVEENKIRDEETGMVVHISQPREEILLTPVSTF